MEDKKQELLFEQLKEDNNLKEIQEYIKKVIRIRGFEKQKIEETMLLLIEETGELAKAIRKQLSNMSIDEEKSYNYDTIESEIADVFIVLLSICNQLNIDAFSTIKEKENVNIQRKWRKNK